LLGLLPSAQAKNSLAFTLQYYLLVVLMEEPPQVQEAFVLVSIIPLITVGFLPLDWPTNRPLLIHTSLAGRGWWCKQCRKE
jgi:hypothetical protein